MTKTIDKAAIKSGTLLLAIVLLVVHAPVGAKNSIGLQFSVHLGYFLNNDTIYTDLYGNGSIPLSFEAGIHFAQFFYLYTGIRYLKKEGETAITPEAFYPESYPIKLSIVSIPVALKIYFAKGKIKPFLGAGVYFHSYQETWESPANEHKGDKVDLLVLVGMEYWLSKMFSVMTQIKYIPLLTGEGSSLHRDINLGGMDLSLGVVFKF